LTGQLHGGVDRRRFRDAVETKELVSAEAQQEQYAVFQFAERLLANVGQGVVEPPLLAQHAVNQFGDQAAVARIETRVALQFGVEGAVGVAAAADSLEDVEGQAPGLFMVADDCMGEFAMKPAGGQQKTPAWSAGFS